MTKLATLAKNETFLMDFKQCGIRIMRQYKKALVVRAEYKTQRLSETAPIRLRFDGEDETWTFNRSFYPLRTITMLRFSICQQR